MNELITYQKLTLLPRDELTNEQKEFFAVHTEMVLAGQKAAECLLIVATNLKRMQEEELYKAAGFEKFSDYVETALNIKERQAFKWISILKLPEEYLTKNAGMGVTKLAAIASASEPVAADLMDDDTTANKSKTELYALIKAKERELAEKEKQITELESGLQTKDDRISELEEEIDEISGSVTETDITEYENKIAAISAELEEAQSNLKQAETDLAARESEIEELSNKAPEVITETVEKTVEVENPETQKALEEARAAAETARKEKEEYAAQAEKYQVELNAYKIAQEAVATFKVYAAGLFETWDNVISAVGAIKEANTELAGKCLEKLDSFCNLINSDIEGMRK